MKQHKKGPIHVLVVDDDESILDAICLLLEDFGYVVETLSNGDETAAAVEELCPSVVLLDVLMSGIDGREICKNLKKSELTKNTPVIMLSAHPGVAKKISEVGADGFLSKPFEVEELLNVISKFVQL
jgi:DNA-binding response OmpR family regulator